MRIKNTLKKMTIITSLAARARARAPMLVVIALSVLLNACSRREYRVSEHEDARVTERVVEHAVESQAREQVTGNEADSRSSTPDIEPSSLVERSNAFFTETRLLNPALANSQQTADELGKINRSILALVDSKQAGSEVLTKVLESYKHALLLGCGEKDLNGCQSFRVFQRDPGSLPVVIALSKRESDLKESYRLLRLAYTLQGRNGSPDLDAAYLSRSLSYYKKLTPGSAEAREHLEIVQQIVARMNQGSGKDFNPQWIQEFEPWNFQRTRLPEMASIDEQVLQLALRMGIYESRENGKLSASFQKLIQDSAQAPTGLMTKLKNLRPELLRSLNIKEQLPLNEYFFIFDGLYTEKLSTTDASIIWQSTRQDVKMAQANLLLYMRLRLAILVHEGNSSFQNFLVSKGRFTSGSAIVAALEHGNRLSTNWAVGINRFAALKTIADRHMRNETPEAKGLETFYLGLDRNVKFLATYPNMFLVAYHLARLNFSTRHFVGGRQMDLNAATVFQGLFDGKWQPWFEFSRDMTPLSAPEILLAFHFALKTGAFDGAGITLENFFQVLIEKMIGVDNENLKTTITNFRNELEGNSMVGHFAALCGKLQNLPRSLNSGTRLPSISLPLSTLTNYTYHGVPARKTNVSADSSPFENQPMSPLLRSAWQFYESERSSSKLTYQIVEEATISFAPRVAFIRLLVNLLETHLKESRATNANLDIASTLTKINSVLAPFERTKLIANTTLLHYHRRFSSCIERMSWAEIDSRTFLLHSYVQHLRDVHAAMSQAISSGSANNGGALDGKFNLNGVNGISIQGLAQHEASLGFDKGLYRFSKLQLFLRFRNALEYGFTTSQGQIAPLREVGTFALPHSVDELDTTLTERTIALPYTQDLSAFISNGLRALLGTNDFIVWPDDDTLLGGLTMRLDVMRNLAKSGELDVCDPASSGCSATKKDRLTMQELVNAQVESLRMVELDDTWIGFLRSAGINNRFRVKRPAYITDLVVDSADGSVLGLLDGTFRGLYLRLSANAEGAPSDAKDKGSDKRIDPLDQAEQYFTATQSMGSSSFEISPSYNELLRNFYGTAADHALTRTAEFVREAQAVAKSGGTIPNWNHYVTRRYPDQIPVLTSGLVDEFRSRATRFSRRTQRPLPADVTSLTGNQN